METKNINRILVVVLDNLGDAVMATSMLKPLKRRYPGAQIGFWVKDYAAGLFSDQSMIDLVHAADPFWDRSPGVAKGSFFKFVSAVNDIRRTKYDLAFVLNTEWRRSIACVVAGIPKRVGYERRESNLFLTDAMPMSKKPQHFVDDHRALLELWAHEKMPAADFVPRLEVTAEQKRDAESWLGRTGWSPWTYTVLHLFSGDEQKNWPLSCWAQLVDDRVRANSSERFVVLCGPSEEIKMAPFRKNFERKEVRFLIAPSLSQLKSILGSASLFVGGDSGPGHVAAALGVPTISLFGDTNPNRSRPLGNGSLRVLQRSRLRALSVDDVSRTMSEIEARV